MNKHLTWFQSNQSFIKREAVEKALGMPKTTINQWTSGQRDLPEKWVKPLTDWIIKFKK